jgi:hypothetical protein
MLTHSAPIPSLLALGACALGLAACDGGGEGGAALTGGAADAGAAGAGVDGATGANPGPPPGPEVPPRSQSALEAWLAMGHHKSWVCEQTISAARLNGAHGRHRICWNDAMVKSQSGPYPVGAASVKEMFTRDDRPNGYAIGVKIGAGTGADTWYWYERTGSSPTARPVADGVAVKICGPDCHAAAPRDNIFIRPP